MMRSSEPSSDASTFEKRRSATRGTSPTGRPPRRISTQNGASQEKKPFFRCILVSLGVFLCLFPSAAPAADSFYTSLMQQGIAAFDRGEFREAQEILRLANFGLLDEPLLLVEGLARLSLAQARAGDTVGFQSTFQRIVEIENRFEAYSKRDLPSSLASSFAETTKNLIPESTLSTLPAFAGLAREQAVDRIASLPKSQRREALSERIQLEPAEPMWRLQLAELAIEEGAEEQAIPLLNQLISDGGSSEKVRCLRGQALATQQLCSEALADLSRCPQAHLQPRFAAPLIRCHSDLGEWVQAKQAFLAMDPSLRSQREFSRLGRRIEKGLKKQLAAQRVASGGAEGSAEQGDISSAAGTDTPADAAAKPPEQRSAPQQTPTAPRRAQAGTSSGGGEPGRTTEPRQGNPTTGTPPRGSNSRETRRVPSSPAAKALTSQEKARLTEARSLLTNAKKVADLEPALELAQSVADAHPESRSAQHLVAEIAYRGSHWRQSAIYFRRGGDPGDNRPNLLFFMAISFYESGDTEAARQALQRSLPRLQRTSFVEDYIQKILGESGR